MVLSDRVEEILEKLWIELVEQKSEGYDAGLVSDTETLTLLVTSGYVEMRDGQVKLTEKGRGEASNCIRRHRLAERLLVDVLDLKKKLVHESGCQFEHLLHKGLDDSICTLLGHPKICPHGRPIPQGSCCKKAKKLAEKVITPLVELEIKKKAKISYLQTQDRSTLQKIIAMGALPNTELVLIQKFPSYVLQIGKSQFAIDRELASGIYVRVVERER